jgi:hypothetical protein
MSYNGFKLKTKQNRYRVRVPKASSVRGRKAAAIKHALSLLPGPGVFLEVAASPRSYRVQAHKQTSVSPHVEEVHARKWKLYAPTQDVA